MNRKKSTDRKLTFNLVTIFVLICCLCITTYALYREVIVEENFFQTGEVSIDLNGGNPVITENSHLFEPGMTIIKDFYIKNNSTIDVYYKLYFSEVTGSLANVIEIEILDGGKTISKGTAATLNKQVKAFDVPLGIGEKKDLKISFHMPEKTENSHQNGVLGFTLCCDAVQTKNNTEKVFE